MRYIIILLTLFNNMALAMSSRVILEMLLCLLATECLASAVPVASKNVLGGQGSTVQLTFRVPLGVDASSIHCEWAHDGNTIAIDNSKYIPLGQRGLEIRNIVGADEGTYTCNYVYRQQQLTETVASINVIGVAAFATGQQENATANVGGTALFDTRVTFVGGGMRQNKQRVNLLQLFKEDGTQVYRCRNWNSYATAPCPAQGRFAVEMQGSDKFSFFLALSDVGLTDGGRYEARLEVIHPETGSYSYIKKIITLMVTDLEPPLPPTIEIEARGEPIQGEPYSLWCNVTVRGSVTVREIALSWQGPSNTVIRSTLTSTNLEVTFGHLSQADEGSYTCVVSVSIQGLEQPLTANATTQVVMDVVLPDIESFQLCVGPFFLSDCSALTVDFEKGKQLEHEVRKEVARNVIKRCPRCSGFSESLIQPGTLRCSENAARLIYRSTIEVTGTHNASEIVQIIEEWVTSTVPGEATLHLWPFVMDLDSHCPVSITSLDSSYPNLGVGASQVHIADVKEHIETCLSADIHQPKDYI